MKKLQRQIVKLLSSLILFSVCMNTYAEGFSDYRLGTGDKLSIKVFGEEELSAEVTLSDAGTISYPFLGEIKVLGMTIGSLSKLITTRLADGYLVNPSINVQVQYNQYGEFDPLDDISPYSFVEQTSDDGNTKVKLWAGVSAGIRF